MDRWLDMDRQIDSGRERERDVVDGDYIDSPSFYFSHLFTALHLDSRRSLMILMPHVIFNPMQALPAKQPLVCNGSWYDLAIVTTMCTEVEHVVAVLYVICFPGICSWYVM